MIGMAQRLFYHTKPKGYFWVKPSANYARNRPEVPITSLPKTLHFGLLNLSEWRVEKLTRFQFLETIEATIAAYSLV